MHEAAGDVVRRERGLVIADFSARNIERLRTFWDISQRASGPAYSAPPRQGRDSIAGQPLRVLARAHECASRARFLARQS